MPKYNYQCKSCEHEFSEVHMIAERDKPCEEPCEKCGEKRVEKKIGAVGFAFDTKVKHSNDFNDKLKEMRKNLPKRNLPIDKAIR